MPYQLSARSRPDLLVRIDARHAETFRSSIVLAQRMLEITHGSKGAIGIMCRGRDRLYGRMPLPGPSDGPVVEAPVALEGYGKGMTLAAQQAVVNEFRRIFGLARNAMSSVSSAFDDRAVYFVYYHHGVFVIVPSEGLWRPAALRFDGAKTMDAERACAEINRASVESYAVAWRVLDEMRRKEEDMLVVPVPMEEPEEPDYDDDREPIDMSDVPFAPRSALDDEEDELDEAPQSGDLVRDAPDPTNADPDEEDGPRAAFDDDIDSVAF